MVQMAVETLGAERIGHGIHVWKNPAVVDFLKKHGILLEVGSRAATPPRAESAQRCQTVVGAEPFWFRKWSRLGSLGLTSPSKTMYA